MPEPVRTRPEPRPLTPEERAQIAQLPDGELTPLNQLETPLRRAVLGAAADRIAKQPKEKGRPFSP